MPKSTVPLLFALGVIQPGGKRMLGSFCIANLMALLVSFC